MNVVIRSIVIWLALLINNVFGATTCPTFNEKSSDILANIQTNNVLIRWR